MPEVFLLHFEQEFKGRGIKVLCDTCVVNERRDVVDYRKDLAADTTNISSFGQVQRPFAGRTI
jgi:hypothetical protein